MAAGWTTIKGGFWCRFGLRNMGVTHAGDNFQNSGHHHLLVDVSEPLDPNEPIPQDKSHLHFGAGQTEARIELPPGKHTLQLVLGDAAHYPFNPPVVSGPVEAVNWQHPALLVSSGSSRHCWRRSNTAGNRLRGRSGADSSIRDDVVT
jgi:hypothetical protein